ncbi:hypothetical protein BJ741DRAFT_580696 [Chytriomyces cf. hyalinus JEL632]|nr:hypothetical protein BJ741DRAFT_580696 [Chytriomyces cf. hyalinus JEL632]
MSYMQHVLNGANAIRVINDDRDASSSFPANYYDAWARLPPQAHAPSSSLDPPHPPSRTFATLAYYGHDHDDTHDKIETEVTLITGPIMESYEQPPTPLLDFTSLEPYQHLVPEIYCEPSIRNFKTTSTQNWNELRATIKRTFLPPFNLSEHPGKLIEQMGMIRWMLTIRMPWIGKRQRWIGRKRICNGWQFRGGGKDSRM